MDVLPRYPGIAPESSSLQVADTLREMILLADTGELLGSEDELIERFGVSRPTFRQAARILQAEGLLRVRRGVNGGLFAQAPTSESVARSVSVLLRHRGASFQDVGSAIQALTGEMARQAAAHPRKADRVRQARAIREFVPPDGATEGDAVLAAGACFGNSLAVLAPNAVVSVLLAVLVDLITEQPDRPRPEGHYDELRRFHIAVADAIAAGDELAAIRLCSNFRGQLEGWEA